MSFLEDRKADWDQLKYLAKHKKDVYQSGRELGAPRLQLLKHDVDKFYPSRWGAYRDYWFGPESARALGSREAVPEDIAQRFRVAANKHMNSNEHHAYKRSENPKPLPKLPKDTRKEILSDWHSVSTRTGGQGPEDRPGVRTWAKERNLDWMHKLGMMIGSKNFGDGFEPDYSPKDLEQMGVYRQVYGDEPSEASMKEWPERWFFGPDKMGWLEWYEKYYRGRRLPEVDRKQISRWKSFKARHGAQYKKNPTERRKAALRNWAIDAEKLLQEKNASAISRKVAQILRHRKNMPQIKDPKKIPCKTKKEVVNPKTLNPSQKSFNAKKVANIKKEIKEGSFNFKPIIISKDNHILDGHHRWKASVGLWAKIPVIRIPKDRKEALDYLKKKVEGKK